MSWEVKLAVMSGRTKSTIEVISTMPTTLPMWVLG